MEEKDNVTAACRLAKVGRRTIYNWIKEDKAFTKKYRVSESIAIEMLEDEARRRAFQGSNKPVYQSGKKIGNVTWNIPTPY